MTFADPDIIAKNTPPPGSAIVCNGCGDCCDPVNLAEGQLERLHDWGRYFAHGGGFDDDADLVAHFAEADDHRPVEQLRAIMDRRRLDSEFAYDHWTSIGPEDMAGRRYLTRCDAFDPVARICTAHEDRPPICRDFPWYGEEPTEGRRAGLSERCSFRDEPVFLTKKPEPE